MANFKSKNLCDKSSKIRWHISCIFRWLRRAILRFFCRRCYHRDIFRPKLSLLKISKKVEKWVFLYNEIGPLEWIVFAFFPIHLLGLSERYVLDPQTLIGDSVFMEIWLKQNRPFSQFSSKISIFSPIKIWSKWYIKIARKHRVLGKKLIKSTLKYTDRGSFYTY